VAKGARLAVLEAMKMEHTLSAGRDGVVAEILAGAGSQVEAGAPLIRLEEEDAGADLPAHRPAAEARNAAFTSTLRLRAGDRGAAGAAGLAAAGRADVALEEIPALERAAGGASRPS
jgi:pyruvate/2-oxoglutarate dehydrogenase complex dihydrolipoamide acyltransferase (E2) component